MRAVGEVIFTGGPTSLVPNYKHELNTSSKEQPRSSPGYCLHLWNFLLQPLHRSQQCHCVWDHYNQSLSQPCDGFDDPCSDCSCLICSGIAENDEVAAVENFIDVGNILEKIWVALYTCTLIGNSWYNSRSLVSGACSAYTEHRCTNNYCIGKRLRCDGLHSCADGSDETTRGAGCSAGSGGRTQTNPFLLPKCDASHRETRDTHSHPSPGHTVPTTTSSPPSKDIYSMSCTLSIFCTLLCICDHNVYAHFFVQTIQCTFL